MCVLVYISFMCPYLSFFPWARGRFCVIMFTLDVNSYSLPCIFTVEQAFAFVYREVLSSVPPSDGNTLKRKAGIVTMN